MQLGVRCVRGKVSHDECRACSLRPLHPCGMPPDILEGMREENDEYEGSEFTPSTLLECDRRTVLYTSRDHWLDPSKAWYLMRGHMIHNYMEKLKYPDGAAVCLVREKRLTTVVETSCGPQKISGKMDLVVVREITTEPIGGDGKGMHKVARCSIVDYKSKNGLNHDFTSPDRKHQMQLNVYAWLVQECLLDLGVDALTGVDRVVVDELHLVYVDMLKVRRFTSTGPTWDLGKEVRKPDIGGVHEVVDGSVFSLHSGIEALSAMGKKPLVQVAGKYHEILSLEAIYLFPDMSMVEAWVIRRIEEKQAAKKKLPPRLEGEAAYLCFFCPMREVCFSIGD